MSFRTRINSTIPWVLLLFLPLLQGCVLFVVGAAAAAGGLLAVNLTQEDTVESRMSGLRELDVYHAALKVFKDKGEIEQESGQSYWAEGEYDSCQLYFSVSEDEDVVVLKVRARTLIETVPAPETARTFQERVFAELDLQKSPPITSPNSDS